MLSETGFLATKYGLFDKADQLHGAIESIYPGTESPAIGRAFNLMLKKDTAQAVGELRKQVERSKSKRKNGPSDLLMAFLGLALLEDGQNSQAEVVITPILSSDENSAKMMAEAMMKEIRFRAS